jgi:hypothetical protein
MICVYVGASLLVQYSEKPIGWWAKACDMNHVPTSGGERTRILHLDAMSQVNAGLPLAWFILSPED